MKLVGFTFIEDQEKFESWQLANPDFSVCTVTPHVREMAINNSLKYESHHDATTVWGVFVMYTYDKAIDA